jgi:dTDP-4-amino-4,6-dideoxygalactose transaminase
MPRSSFLPFSPPCIGEEEIQEVVDTLRSTWITTGPKTHRFEEEFARAVSAPAALALNSCTAGLHVALVTAGVGSGDEVVTSTMTFCASANVIEHVGARPVLVDVEPDTLNIDPDRVEAAVTGRTRAILPVHYAGHPVQLAPIRELATAHDLLVIEDAAHAFPARYRDVPIGAGDNPVAFSFYATKNLTTAEGGMLTAGPEFVDRARVLGLHGMSRDAWRRYDKGGSWRYDVVAPGFKYNLTDIASSLGLHQLRRMPEFQARRREVVAAYNRAFGSVEAFDLPVERPDVESAWHLYVLRLRHRALTIDRDRFVEELSKRNIGTSVHFIPVHLHSFYRDKYGYRPEQFPVALDAFERMVSLPLHPGLSESDVEDVVAAVLDVGARFRR